MAQAETDRIPEKQVSIIPPNELPGLNHAIQEMETECAVLAIIKDKVKSIQVTDAATYAELGQYVAQATAVKKIPEFKLGQFLNMARRVVDWLRTEQNKHANAAEEIIAIGKAKMVEYKRQEVAAAQAEERRINEERRKVAEAQAEAERKAREKEIAAQIKAGEIKKCEAEKLRKQADADAEAAKVNIAEVKVKPSVPSVAGIQIQTNWKFEVVNASLIPRAFLMVDEVSIGQQVRKVVDQETADTHKRRVEALIPGIRVWPQ